MESVILALLVVAVVGVLLAIPSAVLLALFVLTKEER